MSFQITAPNASPWGTPIDERPRANRQTSARPPVAPSPGGYQQLGSSQFSSTPNQLATASPALSNDNSGYFPPQPSSQPSNPATSNMSGYQGQQYGAAQGQDMAGLQQQLGGMNLDSSAGHHTARKKKDRHAYHQLDRSASQTPDGTQLNEPGRQANQGGAPWQQTAQPWQSQTLAAPTSGSPQFHQQAQVPAGTPISFANQGQQPMHGGPGQQNRVNPDQIPSVPLSRDVAAEYYKTHVYPTMEQHLPPPALTPFLAYDQGNASPKHARLTLNCIPFSKEQLDTTGLPLGLVLQPLAPLIEGENAIPVLDFGNLGPPRCRRCRAYINPFMVFTNGGNRMMCNLCGHPNEVPPEYFAPTDPSGVRVDREQRPELRLGTCEFLVPKEYWSKEPMPMRFVFLVDVGAEACTRGFTKAMCDGIKAALFGMSDDEDEPTTVGNEANGETSNRSKLPKGAKVAFMTFDREIHFYNVSASLNGPQQYVMNDLEDPYSAISPEHLFVDAAESKANILKLLELVPNMFLSIKHAETILQPALQAALSTLEVSGGKIICSLCNLPTFGPGRLFIRDKNVAPNDDGDYTKALLKTEHQGFKKLQADMVKAGVGVDFFLVAPTAGYLDVATIGYVAEKTGGETFYYPNWVFPRDCLKLEKEVSHAVQREQGYAALMKVRCSNGLQVAHYSGNFTQHTFGADLELASVTQDSGMCVTFTYDGKLDTKVDAHFQSALLYTTATGERRVRCSNLVATVSDTARESMKFVDQDAVLCVLAKEAAAQVAERGLKDIRTKLQEKTIDILAGYRKNYSGSHPTGQLVLPENLKEFVMYMLGLIKSRALKGGKEPTDRRVQEVRMVKGMGPGELSLYLYPRMIALHNLDETEGFADENGYLKMPRAIRASFANIEDGGAYLVDNGQVLLLWLHAQVSPNLLEDLFGSGFTTLQQLDPNMSALPVLETHLNAQARNVLLHLEQSRGSKGLAVQLARQGLDGAEYEFARLLYEDRSTEASSYVDWLVLLHRGVGTELSGQRSKGEGGGGGALNDVTNAISSFTGSVPYWG